MTEKEALISSNGAADYNSINQASGSQESAPSDVEVKEPWTRTQKLTAVILALLNLAFAISFSVIAPFFPYEAGKKGATPSDVGMIFGVFNLVIFITSPIYGNFIDRLGAKFMYLAGAFLMGGCNILFGFLDKAPDGAVFVAMCYVVRCIEANGTSMMATASFAIMAKTFPKNVGATMGILETFSGVGMIVGPSIGGGLYTAGGYKLPFIVVGSISLTCTAVAFFALPSIKQVEPFNGSIFSMLKIPGCVVIYFTTVACAIALAFLDPTFSPFMLKTFPWLAVGTIGLIFMTAPGLYAFAAPLCGWMSDKGYQASTVIVGLLLCGTSFLFLGPSPLFKSFLPASLPETIIALAGMGLTVGLCFIPLFPLILRHLKSRGFDDSLKTYGMLSGFFNSAFSLGGFIGPTAAGYLADKFGFPTSASICGGFLIFMGIVMLIYVSIMKATVGWPIKIPDEDELQSTASKAASPS